LEFLKISKELHTVLAARTHLAEGQWLEEPLPIIIIIIIIIIIKRNTSEYFWMKTTRRKEIHTLGIRKAEFVGNGNSVSSSFNR
jgi:hypothetical protein